MRVFLHAILTWSSSFIDKVCIVANKGTQVLTYITILIHVKLHCIRENQMNYWS